MSSKQNFGRKKKSKFKGNRYTKSSKVTETLKSSLRYQKISKTSNETSKKDDDNYFLFVNFKILKDLISSLTCSVCNAQKLSLSNKLDLRMGFANKVLIKCFFCDRSNEFYTSPTCSCPQDAPITVDVYNEKNISTQGRNLFEINVRNVIAFRENGKGLAGIKCFARCLNMESLSEPSYRNIISHLHKAYNNVASNSIVKAVGEIKLNPENKTHLGITTCRVSVDGSWKKRRFSSLNGYVAAINHGKCIDVNVMTKCCRQCKIWNRKKGSEEHQNWLSKHNCPINHQSSSGAMESTGAVEIFQRSVLKNNLIYNEYLGDGDTSSYKEVFASNVYKDYGNNPIKLECVGHVQKKCGNRLRNLCKKLKGTKNSLSGRGKLTDKTINSMQNFYGLAIRQNLNI